MKRTLKPIFIGIILFLGNLDIHAQTVEQVIKEAEEANTISKYLYAAAYCHSMNKDNYMLKMYQKAADIGSPDATFYISLCYSYGMGTDRDDVKGFEWCKKSADLGFAEAYGQLAWHYAEGRGCAKDPGLAVKYCHKAIENGVTIGYYHLAYHYALGEGCPKSMEKALEYANIAIEKEGNGYMASQYFLAKGDIFSIFKKQEEAWNIYYELQKMDIDELEQSLTEDHGTKHLLPYLRTFTDNVDGYIPKSAIHSNDTYCLVIGNENYKNVAEVPHAINDSFTFFEYCYLTLGVPKQNIHFVHDISLGQMRREVNWLKQNISASNGKAKVIVYYAGHGIPDEQTQTAFLLPVDGTGTNVRTGYSLKSLYSALASQPSEQVTVFLDACFSGTKRDGDMLTSARGVALKVKEEKPQGNMVVLSAAQGDETAYPYPEKKHGLFTYYLLKKLQDSEGNITIGELSDYITENVRKISIVNNGKMQTPTILLGNDNCKNLKLK